MEGYNDSYKIEAGIKSAPENNPNKIAFNEMEADKTKRRRGAILAALLQMGITTTSLEAMGAPVQNPENVAEQILKEEQKTESEIGKSSITTLTPTEEMKTPLGENKNIESWDAPSQLPKSWLNHDYSAGEITITVPKNMTAEQKETLKHQMDEMARKMIEQNHQQ